MKKFNDYLAESLAGQVKSEPSSAAAKQAKKMGLVYAGFGRYSDAQGAIAYVVHNDQLVPYKKTADVQQMYDKAMNTDNPEKAAQMTADADANNRVLKSRAKEDQAQAALEAGDIEAMNDELNLAFTGSVSEDHIAAIQDYITNSFDAVNRFLYKGHDEGADTQSDAQMAELVSNIDSAFDEALAPIDFSTYMGLSNRYSPDKIVPGQPYLFRGYVSTSLDPTIAMSGFENQETVLFQVDVMKNQRALHLDSITGEKDTLLPRGTVIQVQSGPHPFDTSPLGIEMDTPISLFHCTIVEE